MPSPPVVHQGAFVSVRPSPTGQPRHKARVNIDAYRVNGGAAVDLRSLPTRSEAGGDAKATRKALARQRRRISRFQERLFASSRTSLLLVFQGMDAAGKDGAIRSVLKGVNPQGISVTSFKQPVGAELTHSWLWRHWLAAPERGQIGVFNRSHYEEVAVVRVHPELLAERGLSHPPPEEFWDERLEDIRAFERHLVQNGTHIAKFYLHVSRQEQRRRIMRRLDDRKRQWKFHSSDITETALREDYLHAYQTAIAGTATESAPWFIIPADHKPTARLLVATAIAETLAAMGPEMPRPGPDALRAIADFRDTLANMPEDLEKT